MRKHALLCAYLLKLESTGLHDADQKDNMSPSTYAAVTLCLQQDEGVQSCA